MSRTWRRENKEHSVRGYDSTFPKPEWERDLDEIDRSYRFWLIMIRSVTGFILLMLFLAAVTRPAHAQAGVAETVSIVTTSTASGVGSCAGGGCTSTGVATIKVNQYRKSLTFDNTGNSINVGFCFGTCTAAIGTGGTQTLAAGTNAFWPAGSAPNAAIVFISASGTPAVTVREGK